MSESCVASSSDESHTGEAVDTRPTSSTAMNPASFDVERAQNCWGSNSSDMLPNGSLPSISNWSDQQQLQSSSSSNNVQMSTLAWPPQVRQETAVSSDSNATMPSSIQPLLPTLLLLQQQLGAFAAPSHQCQSAPPSVPMFAGLQLASHFAPAAAQPQLAAPQEVSDSFPVPLGASMDQLNVYLQAFFASHAVPLATIHALPAPLQPPVAPSPFPPGNVSNSMLEVPGLNPTAVARSNQRSQAAAAAVEPGNISVSLQTRKRRPYGHESAPEKLYRLLEECAADGMDDIVSFNERGTAFKIHKVDEFCESILPKYFRHGKLQSFKRLLNM